jgi:hypothetical protein
MLISKYIYIANIMNLKNIYATTLNKETATIRVRGFDFRPRLGIVLSFTALSPIQWVPGAIFPWIKVPEHEADHSHFLVPRSRMNGAVPPPPIHVHGVVLR